MFTIHALLYYGRLFFSFLLFFAAFHEARAQPCGDTFITTFGEPGLDDGAVTVTARSDGFLYVGGYYDEEALIAKMTPEGELVWSRRFDLTNRPDHVTRLITDSDGYLVGINLGRTQAASRDRTSTIFRYDPDNDVMLWHNTYHDALSFFQVMENPADGHFLVSGAFHFPGSEDAILGKIDRNTGELIWRREYNRGSSDGIYDLAPVGDTLFAVGRYTHTSQLGTMRVNLTALDTNGDLQFSNLYLTPTSVVARQYAFALETDGEDLYIAFTGNPDGTSLTSGSVTGILKTDRQGNPVWAKQYLLAGYMSSLGAYGMTTTSDGFLLYGYAVGGDTDLIVIKTDADGEAQWAYAYGGAGEQTPYWTSGNEVLLYENYLYITGRTGTGGGTDDPLIIKAQTDGAVADPDCFLATPVAVATEALTSLHVEPSGLMENPNGAINPALTTVSWEEIDVVVEVLCDPGECEACDNGIDDDGDGLTDCADPDLAGDCCCYEPPLLDLGPDVAICSESVALSATGGFDAYQWQNGATGPQLTATTSGLYWVEAVDSCGNAWRDTLVVTLLTDVETEQQAVICEREAHPFGDQLLTQPGLYTDTLTADNGCDSLVTLDLQVANAWEVFLQETICEGGSVSVGGQIYATPGSYLDTLATAAGCDSIVRLELSLVTNFETVLRDTICRGEEWVVAGQAYSQTGVYRDTLPATGGCDSVLIIDLTVAAPTPFTLGPDRTLLLGDSLVLDIPGYFSYRWTPSAGLSCDTCTAVVLRPSGSAVYTLTATDASGCSWSESLALTVERRLPVYLPNVFSLNGDGINDTFTVFARPGSVREISRLQIFDRWGELVFEKEHFPPNDPADGWDGSFRGESLKPAVFVYLVEVVRVDGTSEVLRGEVVLLR